MIKIANAGLSGSANAAGAMLTGAAYQLNGAVASASTTQIGRASCRERV